MGPVPDWMIDIINGWSASLEGRPAFAGRPLFITNFSPPGVLHIQREHQGRGVAITSPLAYRCSVSDVMS